MAPNSLEQRSWENQPDRITLAKIAYESLTYRETRNAEMSTGSFIGFAEVVNK
jgi:hypothetical protein